MKPVDLSNCDTEPIHAPGTIQPFGALLVLNPVDRTVSHFSANLTSVLGMPDALPPGSKFPPLRELFSSGEEALLRGAFEAIGEDEGSGESVRLASASGRPLRGFPYHNRDNVVLEFEPVLEAENAPLLGDRFSADLVRMHRASSCYEACSLAAELLARLTGYERVSVYRFHPDDHGEVFAESILPSLDSYLGLHYPATDIPAPARRVFRINRLRFIPDVNYEPVPLLSATEVNGGEEVDLSRSLLRSVSPIHLEYVRNMGMKGTLTLALVARGRLWGLLTCGMHSSPKFLSVPVRSACEMVAEVLSAILPLKEDAETAANLERMREVQALIVKQRDEAGDCDLFGKKPDDLLPFASAGGAAVYDATERKWVCAGQTPPQEELTVLAKWLVANQSGDLFVTDSLSERFDPAGAYKEHASGLLAIGIPSLTENLLMWFRPEVLQTVRWGGNPGKPVAKEGNRLHPRNSFAEWCQTVDGRSEPWERWEVEAARELRVALLALDYRRRLTREQVARREAEAADQVKKDLMAVVSHDLKNPLGAILLNTGLIRGILPVSAQEKVARLLDSIERSTGNMRRLTTDLLDVTKLEAGHVQLELSQHEAASLLDEAVALLSPLVNEQGLRLSVDAPAGLLTRCDRERTLQVLSNLAGNAIKFTEPGGRIDLSARAAGSNIKFIVRDTGVGIPAENLPYLFDRFWQAKASRVSGSGLGLAIAKGLVEAQGGSIEVESQVGHGTTFIFTLPKAA